MCITHTGVQGVVYTAGHILHRAKILAVSKLEDGGRFSLYSRFENRCALQEQETGQCPSSCFTAKFLVDETASSTFMASEADHLTRLWLVMRDVLSGHNSVHKIRNILFSLCPE